MLLVLQKGGRVKASFSFILFWISNFDNNLALLLKLGEKKTTQLKKILLTVCSVSKPLVKYKKDIS